jgi:hypothetical protein
MKVIALIIAREKDYFKEGITWKPYYPASFGYGW